MEDIRPEDAVEMKKQLLFAEIFLLWKGMLQEGESKGASAWAKWKRTKVYQFFKVLLRYMKNVPSQEIQRRKHTSYSKMYNGKDLKLVREVVEVMQDMDKRSDARYGLFIGKI